MYIFDIENKSLLKDVLLENLKHVGVRCRLPKKLKEHEKENVYSDNQIFQKPLHLLKKCVTNRLNGTTIEVPEFLVDACTVIEKDIKTEGIFRKAGSTCKQKERKLELNSGKKVNCDYHVLDACSLVKLFFRELPQPIIPFGYHDIFLKCLLLSTYEKELDALLMASLLLPEENLATLAFFMEFLWKVSQHADRNKMNVKNLAIILTPTLMPMTKASRASSNLEMAHHFKVIEMLIENAERIGNVPEHIVQNIISVNKKHSKKKRSSSITRMFTGLKKIVGSKSSNASELDDSPVSTPDSFSSLGKRKNSEWGSKGNIPKKKRIGESSPGVLTPLRCRMHAYMSSDFFKESVEESSVKKNCTRSPSFGTPVIERRKSERDLTSSRPSRLNLVRRCTTKKQKSQSSLVFSASTGALQRREIEQIPIERKPSVVLKHKKSSLSLDFSKDDKNQNQTQENMGSNIKSSNNEFITVPKSEYEEIKNRVSALEEDLEKLNVAHSIQTAYEKTLEESERLIDGSADQLARRLSKELKIRRSLDSQIIRSPSARKIGSIRRRSKELVQKNVETKSNLKRGRPNTLRTGLPSPRARALSSENVSSPIRPQIVRSATFRDGNVEWRSGEIFFAKDHLLQKLTPVPQGRPSLAEIRCQNAGMVLEKAKLFNSLNDFKDSGSKIPRRQSVRLENVRRMHENDKSLKKSLARTESLGSNDKLKSINEIQLNEIYTISTPKPQKTRQSRKETPLIKKSLVGRSPKNFAKTPLSQMKSAQRGRTTPMKALIEAGGTPHIGLRRSPRILARTINNPPRLRD